MSEFHDGFVEAYHGDISSIFDIAEELTLIHTPDVFINGSPYSDDFDTLVGGYPLEAIDRETPEGLKAWTRAHVGLINLTGFGAAANMELIAETIGEVLPSDTVATPEQEALADAMSSHARTEIENGEYSHSSFEFANEDTHETMSVALSQMSSPTSAIHARRLRITIKDDYIKKELVISELPTSFDGSTKTDITQTIQPVNTEILQRAARLFFENDSYEDLQVLSSLFAAELAGKHSADDEIEELLAKYAVSEQLDSLKDILAGIKQHAQDIKLGSAFNLANPGMTLPSAAELFEYKAMLSQMRA